MIKPNPRQQKLIDKLEKLGVETDLSKRWEVGSHHPKSITLFNYLDDIDWLFGDDAFCWKRGGDGDNGEAFMYELDIYFDMLDEET